MLNLGALPQQGQKSTPISQEVFLLSLRRVGQLQQLIRRGPQSKPTMDCPPPVPLLDGSFLC